MMKKITILLIILFMITVSCIAQETVPTHQTFESGISTDNIDSDNASFILVEDDIKTPLGATILNEAASATNPTLIPYVGNESSGIGGTALAGVTIIRNNTTRLLADEFGNTLYGLFIIPNITGSGTGTSILVFDRASGNVTYKDEASGGTPTDTFVIDSVAHMLSDSATYPFALGSNVTGNDAGFVSGAYMGGWYHQQDTCVALVLRYESQGISASVPFKIVYGSDYSETETIIFSGTATTTLQTSTTFTTKLIPPGNRVWAYQDGASSGTPLLILVDLLNAITR